MLLQEGWPVAYESRKLSSAEHNYSTGEQELLAVVHAMRSWRCYLEGVEFTMVTDHNHLTYLQTQPNLSKRQVRWSEYLQMFRFRWQYSPGRINVADPLSRVQTVAVAAVTRGQTRTAVPKTVVPPDPSLVLPEKPDSAAEGNRSLTNFQQQVQKGYQTDLGWFDKLTPDEQSRAMRSKASGGTMMLWSYLIHTIYESSACMKCMTALTVVIWVLPRPKRLWRDCTGGKACVKR